jgi:AcrR family transcriptional regulator
LSERQPVSDDGGRDGISRMPVGLDADTVIAAALALIDERGPDAFTIRALATRVGVSAPTIYWHVGSKADLLAAVVERVLTNMTVVGRTHGDWEARLRGFLATVHQQLLAHPGVIQLIARVHTRALGTLSAEALDIMTSAGFDERDAPTYARITLLHVMQSARSDATAVDYVEAVPGRPGESKYRVKPHLLAENLADGVILMTSYDLVEQHRITTNIFVAGVRAQLPPRP